MFQAAVRRGPQRVRPQTVARGTRLGVAGDGSRAGRSASSGPFARRAQSRRIQSEDPRSTRAHVANATRRLITCAERHSLADGQWLGYQWDNPEITSLEDCQYHVAVEAERFVASGEVGRFRFPAMIVAQVEVRGGIDLELRALQWLYGTWLPRSGYVPDDQPGFEAWIGRPFAHGTEHFELYAQLPIKRA